MRIFFAASLLLLLAACSGGADGDEPSAQKTLSSTDAMEQTCAEVRAGIDDFNRQDYPSTVRHFEKAKVTAKIYAEVNPEPDADALLDAVEYYANLAPSKYPEAARSSENFARNKAITLGQCASGEPIDETPPTAV